MRHNDTPRLSTMSLAEKDAFIEARHVLYTLTLDQLDTPMFNGRTPRQVLMTVDKIVETL